MKKAMYLTALCLSLVISSCAVCDFGVRGGATFANIGGDDTDNLDSRTGLVIGAYSECSILDMVSIIPEIQFAQLGAKYSESDGYDGKFKLNYLNLPVTGRAYVSDGFFLEAGPQLGFLLSAKDEYNSPGDSGEEDIKDDLKNLDFGGNVGLGYQFDSGLNFGARYYFGIANIQDFADTSDISNTNNVFSLAVGFRF